MTGKHTRRLGVSRRVVILRAVVTALIASGIGCLAIALTHQGHAPQADLQTAGTELASTAPAVSVLRGSAPVERSTKTVGPTLRRSLPTRVRIPAIGVNSRLQQLGQAADGSLQVPVPGPMYAVAGWYRYSPTPGSLGPSVIVGHLDSAKGPSVFYRLGELKPHDFVRVDRADGTTATFVVTSVKRYAKAEFPTRLVYGDSNYAALRLVTCGGPIDPSTGHYRDNVIVMAKLLR